jgi:osmoprotectant transport system ATP-binding protein
MIIFDDVTKRYPDGTLAVDGLTLEIRTGELTVLLGTSGSGKTTALRMVNRLIEPTSGSITLDGREVTAVPVHELRRGIGYVIQQPSLFPHRTVADNIATVPRLMGWNRNRQRARALDLLELVGLNAAMAHRYPAQLSGGQQQRVGVARALAADPPVLLMDEPFGAVDPVRRGTLQHDFAALQRDLGKTVVFVTHDVDEAVLLGDRIAIMGQGGDVAQYGTPEQLLTAPADAFVAEFLGSTRGLKLLSLRPAAAVPVQPISAGGVAGWTLATDARGIPIAWVPLGGGAPTAAEPVGPLGSLRDLLDSALASPARAAVRVDAGGRLIGTVPFATLEPHLPASVAGSERAVQRTITPTAAVR